MTIETLISHDYAYIFTDLRNNSVLGELPLQGVSYENALSSVGSCGGKIRLNEDTRKLNVKSMTTPGQVGLYILRDGNPVWGGIVWKRTYDGDNRELTLACKTFESYYYHRFQRFTRFFGGVDQLDIARWLVSTSNNSSSTLGITVSTNMSGRIRDRTMFDYEFKTVGQELEQLSNLIDGFDWNVEVTKDANGVMLRKLVFSYPFAGAPRENTQLTFEYPGAITSFNLSEDAENSGNSVWAIGAGEGTEQVTANSQDPGQIRNGWPLIETSRSYKSVLSPITLQDHVNKDISRLRTPVTVFEVKVNPNKNPVLGQYRLGDWARFIIEDPFLTPAFDSYARITGINVSVDGSSGLEEVSLVLGGDEVRTEEDETY